SSPCQVHEKQSEMVADEGASRMRASSAQVYDRLACAPWRRLWRITMMPLYFSVDVLMERIPLVNRWVSEKWQPASVVPAAEGPATPGVPTRVADGPNGTLWRFPGFPVELHPTEAEGYYLNLTSDTPLVFVM